MRSPRHGSPSLSQALRGALAIGALSLLVGCQAEYAGMNLPSMHYLNDDVQYFAPGPHFPWANTQAATQRARMELMGVPLPEDSQANAAGAGAGAASGGGGALGGAASGAPVGPGGDANSMLRARDGGGGASAAPAAPADAAPAPAAPAETNPGGNAAPPNNAPAEDNVPAPANNANAPAENARAKDNSPF